MVGGFVKQQQIGATHQRTRQIQTHAPSAGKAGNRIFQCVVGKAKSVQQLRGTCLGTIAVDVLKTVLRIEPFSIVIFTRQRFFQ